LLPLVLNKILGSSCTKRKYASLTLLFSKFTDDFFCIFYTHYLPFFLVFLCKVLSHFCCCFYQLHLRIAYGQGIEKRPTEEAREGGGGRRRHSRRRHGHKKHKLWLILLLAASCGRASERQSWNGGEQGKGGEKERGREKESIRRSIVHIAACFSWLSKAKQAFAIISISFQPFYSLKCE